MSRYILLLLSAFFITFFTPATAQEKTPADSLALFQEVKKQYQAYEKKHGHYIQTPNVKMHYLKWENPGGVPLVWNHGGGMTGYEILPFVDDLLAMGFEVYAPDCYYHGKSINEKKDVSIYHYADDISAMMKENKIEKAIIGGFSQGGFISTVFYDVYPEKVLGLVLLDGGTGSVQKVYMHENDEELNEWAEKIRGLKWPNEHLFSTEYEAWLFFQNKYFKSNVGVINEDIDHNLLDMMSFGFMQQVDKQWALNYSIIKAFGPFSGMGQVVKRPWEGSVFFWSAMGIIPSVIFRNLDIPLFIIDPQMEGKMPDYHLENKELASDYPELVVHSVYNHSGHAGHYFQPERFLADVEEFLGKVKAHHGLK